jgi:hypothetical protein
MARFGCKKRLSFAKTLKGHKSRPVTMLQAGPHAIHFKRILDFGERQPPFVAALTTRIAGNLILREMFGVTDRS